MTATPAATEKEAITKLVCGASEPDIIYLLAAASMKQRISSIFTTDPPSCHYTSHCLLLVLESSASATHEVQEKVESHCRPVMPVSAIIVKTEEFREWLATGHPFAATVTTRAERLYHNNAASLPAVMLPKKETQQAAARNIYNTGNKRVISFLAGADLFRVRTEYGMAAFMLHQATECGLRTALHVLTGYYCNTHSLDKLYRFASFLLWRLPDIFERHKPAGEALFSLLQRAYVEPRYKDGYKISLTELEALFTKVQQLSDHLKEAIINSLVEVS